MEELKGYVTLRQEASEEYIIKKSVFIGHAAPVRKVEDAEAFIALKKEEYADATHNVSAFTLRGGAMARYSDDGEPQGTAGPPVLEVLKKSGVDNAVIVVTRYFGGILLGAGGLVRAYTEAAKLALDAAGIVTCEPVSMLSFSLSYSDHKKIQKELEKFTFLTENCLYDDKVTLSLSVRRAEKNELVSRVRELTAGRAGIEEKGEKLAVL